MRYEEYKIKEKIDFKTNIKTGKLESKKIKPDVSISLENIKNMNKITLTKINNTQTDYFVVGNLDEDNLKNSKITFKHFAFDEKKYYNIEIENIKNSNFFKRLIMKCDQSFWRIKVNEITKNDAHLCEIMETEMNSEEDIEIKNILENDNLNIESKFLKLFELYKYKRIKEITKNLRLNM
ncbi:hypothetical protein KSU11_01145 [Fusobacterium nucleatum]|uniref:hypothetical protein n=1 Tax=Fusobacterium nucleatum TaxID=851 RepID=UPI0030CC624F